MKRAMSPGELADAPTSAIMAATAAGLPHQANALARARAFAEPLLASEQLDTGENTLALETTKLVQLQRQARTKAAEAQAKKLEERQAAQDAGQPAPGLAKAPVSELAASQT